MRVLVGCEFSGRVRDAFTARGHYAMSCDLLESETPGPHYRGDVRDVLGDGWDLMVAFPPCTDLSKVNASHWKVKQDDGRQGAALAFVLELMRAPVPRIAIENPVGRISSALRPPDQIIQPWQFGDPWIKETCLWLEDLQPLWPSHVIRPVGHWVDGGTATRHKDRVMGDADHGAKFGREEEKRTLHRSKTFHGIADAMAVQWGSPEDMTLFPARNYRKLEVKHAAG